MSRVSNVNNEIHCYEISLRERKKRIFATCGRLGKSCSVEMQINNDIAYDIYLWAGSEWIRV